MDELTLAKHVEAIVLVGGQRDLVGNGFTLRCKRDRRPAEPGGAVAEQMVADAREFGDDDADVLAARR